MTKKTDTKAEATTSVVVAEKRLIGQPGVIAIGGVILEPIIQIPKINGKVDHNGVLLADYDFTRFGDKTAKLSIYSYKVGFKDGRPIDLFVVADELSSLDLSVPGWLDFQDGSFTVITLVNSSSKNDYFQGGVVLVNVDTQDNAFTDSIIEMNTRYYWMRSEDKKNNPSPNRVELIAVDAHKLKLQGNQLPPGNYRDSDLYENTFIRGEKDDNDSVNIWGSNLRHNNFREGKISVHNSTVSMSGFHITGDVLLDEVTVENEYFTQLPGVYMTSKFDLTLIDVAGKSPAKMIRVDQDNVLITLPAEKDEFRLGGREQKLLTMSFRHPHSRRALRCKAMDLLFGESAPSEIEESVLDYLVDTLLSRCSMMNLVDSAKRLLNNTLLGVKPLARSAPPVPGLPPLLGPHLDARAFEGYGVSSEQAIENARAIYIDGKNF